MIFSRDELKQYEMRKSFDDDRACAGSSATSATADRLMRAMHGVDYVVHAAALKQVDTAEYNPFEYVKTNVLGCQNVIDAAIDAGVKQVVALSTDKASSPINLYGATKLTADKLFVAGNHYAGRIRHRASPSCATATSWAAAARSSRSSASSRRGQAAADHRRAHDPLLDHACRRRSSSSSTRSTG